MKNLIKILITTLLITSSIHAASGQEIFDSKCSVCHGMDGDASASGKSGKIRELDAHAIEEYLLTFRNMLTSNDDKFTNVMRSITSNLTKDDIREVSKYVATLKDN